jgi:hypothetical protein
VCGVDEIVACLARKLPLGEVRALRGPMMRSSGGFRFIVHGQLSGMSSR